MLARMNLTACLTAALLLGLALPAGADEALDKAFEALKTYERAIAIDPSSRNLRRNIMMFHEFYDSYIEPEEELEDAEEGSQPPVSAPLRSHCYITPSTCG